MIGRAVGRAVGIVFWVWAALFVGGGLVREVPKGIQAAFAKANDPKEKKMAATANREKWDIARRIRDERIFK